MRLTSHDHVTKPTAILSGKKCTVAIVRLRVYVRFVAVGRVVALLDVQTGTRKVRIKASTVFQWNRTGEQDGLQQ